MTSDPIRTGLVVAALMAVACAHSPQRSYPVQIPFPEWQPELAYSISVRFEAPQRLGVSVCLQRDGKRRSTSFQLPAAGVTAITAGPGSTVQRADDPAVVVVRYAAEVGPVCLAYEVPAGQAPARPAISGERIELVGAAVLALPLGEPEHVYATRIGVLGLPADWRLLGPDTGAEPQRELDATATELGATQLLGGRYRFYTVDQEGNGFAVRGAWSFDDEALQRVVARLVSGASECKDHAFGNHVIFALQPADPERPADSGRSAWRLDLPSSFRLDPAGKLFVAEYMYGSCMSGVSKRLEVAGTDAFWTGLTRYAARVSALQAGVLTLTEYVESYNADLAREGEPAVRGQILAHAWDQRLRARGEERRRSFSELLDTMAMQPRPDLADAFAFAWVDDVEEASVRQEIQRYVVGRERPEPAADALGPCVRYRRTEEGPRYELDRRQYVADPARCEARFAAPDSEHSRSSSSSHFRRQLR